MIMGLSLFYSSPDFSQPPAKEDLENQAELSWILSAMWTVSEAKLKVRFPTVLVYVISEGKAWEPVTSSSLVKSKLRIMDSYFSN